MLVELYRRTAVPLREHFGVQYPEYFVHPAAEYAALSTYCGVIDLMHWTVLRLRGKDRVGFLNAMVTNDVAKLETNRGCHALLTTTKGKIVAELYVYVRDDDALVLVAQGDGAEVRTTLEKHIVMDDVTVEDVSASYAVIAAEGPKSYDCLWRMFPTGPFPKEHHETMVRQFEHIDISILKNSVSGEEGYHLMVPREEIERIRNYAVQAARGSDGLAVGYLAWNMRRAENGVPWYGCDFTTENFPHESGLEETVSYSKGCFRGQETLARLKYRGHVNRLLVGLSVEDENVREAWKPFAEEFLGGLNNYDETGLRGHAGPAAERLRLEATFPRRAPIFTADAAAAGAEAATAAGWVTTSVFSPKLGRPLLLGYVRTESAETGTELVVTTPTGPVAVRPTSLPLE